MLFELLILTNLILKKKFRLRVILILIFVFLFVSYQYSNFKTYLVANNIRYKVQISAVHENKIPIDFFKKKFALNENIREDFHKGWYKYSVGNFPIYYDAKEFRDKLIHSNNTYGAFVVMFKDNIRMDGMDTVNTDETTNKKINSQKINYRVQVKASSNKLLINDLKKELNIVEDINEEYIDSWYKYTVGNFENYDDAKNLYSRLTNIDKIKDAFIVTYLGNKRLGIKSQKEYNNITQTYPKYKSQSVIIKKEVSREVEPRKITKYEYKRVVYKPVEKKAEPEKKVQLKNVDIILFHFNESTRKINQNQQQEQSHIIEKQENIIIQNPKEIIPKTENIQSRDIILYHYNNQDPTVNINQTQRQNERYSNNESSSKNYTSDIYYSQKSYTKKNTLKKRSYFGQFIYNLKNNFYKKFFIKVLILLIIAFIFNILLVTIVVFISRFLKIAKEERIKNLQEDYQLLLAEFLFDPTLEKEAFRKLKAIDDTFSRNILIGEITKITNDLAGEILIKLKKLYYDLGLNKDSLSKLKNDKWFIKVRGCKELTIMKAYDAKSEIEKLINSKNEILRSEAQIAIVDLSEENPYYFLDKLEKPFLPWEQLNVQVIMQKNAYEIPDFSKWLLSKNETVILFAIEMIRVYRQITNAPKIIKFFNHPNSLVRETAIDAAGELGYVEVVPEMIKYYYDADDISKVKILRSMKKLPDDTNKDFLKGILDSSSPQHIKLEAAKALFALGVIGQIELKRYAQTGDIVLNSIIKHVFDERVD